MLLNITSKCSMNCIHCMDDCKKDGIDIDFNTLKKICDKIKDWDIKNIIVSGGEPTEHDDFIEVYRYLNHRLKNKIFTITSNGINLEHNEKLYNDIYKINKDTLIQITNDERYYPKRINKDSYLYKNKNVVLIDTIEKIYPLGRAKDNNLPYQAKASKCFNLRLLTAQLIVRNKNTSLKEINETLENNFRFCSFGYDFNGLVKLGESNMCKTIGSINDNDDHIINNILYHPCHTCDYINQNLNEMYFKIIEMAQTIKMTQII